MDYFTKLGIIFAGAISCQAFAATLSAPEYFDIMYVDEEKAELIEDQNQVNLSAGHHEVVVRYSQEIEWLDEDRSFSSEPIFINFSIQEADEFKITAVKPAIERTAEAFEENPEFTVVNQENAAVEYQSQLLPLKPGFQWGRDYLQEIKDFKAKQNSESKKAKVVLLEAEPEEASLTVISNSPEANELTMLKEWYNKADSETQIAYRFWIIDPLVIPKQDTEALRMLKLWHLKADATTQREIQIWMIK